MLPSTRLRQPCRSVIWPRLLRNVLNRMMLSEDLTEMASLSPLARSNRLYSTIAKAMPCCRLDRPRRMDSPPLEPSNVGLKKELWWIQVRLAMSWSPGPEICRNTPWVLLFWNVLWSTSQSLPAIVSQLVPPESWKTLRVNRMWLAEVGTETAARWVNRNPSTTTLAIVPKLKPAAPRISALPTCAAATVIGAVAVPERLSRMEPLVEYVPSASSIRSPGSAAATARCRAPMDVTVITRVARGAPPDGAARLGKARAIVAPAAASATPMTDNFRRHRRRGNG